MRKPPRDVLFIPSGSIGDAVMMLALCAEMEKHNHGTRFTFIARRNAKLISDLAKAYPFITVMAIERSIAGLLALTWNAFCRPYLAFMPAMFGKSWFLNTEQLFRLLSLRPGTQTFGLVNREDDPNPYTHGFMYDKSLLHIDNMRRLAHAAGLPAEPIGSPILFSFRTSLPAHFPYAPKSYIVFHPFGSSSWKSWPPRRSRELLTQLGELYPNLSFVITGGSENEEEARAITEGIPRTFCATGLPILEVIGIIEGAAIYIGVDTGTMHLACVMQQKVVDLAHNAGPEWVPSYNPNALILTNWEHCSCKGVKNDSCKVIVDGLPYMRCLYEISDETILAAVAGMLSKQR